MIAPLPVLRSLPYFPTQTTIVLGSEPIVISPYQIVVWVSIARVEDEKPPREPAAVSCDPRHWAQ